MPAATPPRPVVAHSVDPFLFETGSWVHAQLVSLRRWSALVLCLERENRERFPFAPVHALQDLGHVRRIYERAAHSLSGTHPFKRRALARSGARLIHAHFANQGWRDLPLARASGLPLITSCYGGDIWKYSRDPLWSARYCELFDAGAAFLVEGRAMRAKLLELGCPEPKIVVHHLGVDLRGIVCRPRRLGEGESPRILAAGRAVEKKGHEIALRAFARVRRELPGARLSLMIIARRQRAKLRLAELQGWVEREGLQGAVDFLPPLPHADFLEALHAHHVFLAPSLHAQDGDAEGGAPVALTEAVASGMPVVASRHCDIPEVAPHGVAGLLFAEGDVEDAAAALLAVAGAPGRWEEWGRAARAHIERDYALERQAAALEAIYDRCAGLSAGPP